MSRDIDHAIQRQRKKRKIELLEEAMDETDEYLEEEERMSLEHFLDEDH